MESSPPPSLPPLPPPLPARAFSGPNSDATSRSFTLGSGAWWKILVGFVLLAAYPLTLPFLAHALEFLGVRGDPGATLLPDDVRGLLLTGGENLLVFGFWFVLAWSISRLPISRLHLRINDPAQTIGLGFAWSIGLRIGLVCILVLVLLCIWVGTGFKPLDDNLLQGVRPKVENLLSPEALRNPWYLITNLTLISFVLAGFREELWRAGMITTFLALLPSSWQNRRGQTLAVVLSAAIFGLAHLPQGWGGVVLTGLLGLGLGSAFIAHRSIWIAVLAHGFFDASTFVALWLLDRYGHLAELLKK